MIKLRERPRSGEMSIDRDRVMRDQALEERNICSWWMGWTWVRSRWP